MRTEEQPKKRTEEQQKKWPKILPSPRRVRIWEAFCDLLDLPQGKRAIAPKELTDNVEFVIEEVMVKLCRFLREAMLVRKEAETLKAYFKTTIHEITFKMRGNHSSGIRGPRLNRRQMGILRETFYRLRFPFLSSKVRALLSLYKPDHPLAKGTDYRKRLPIAKRPTIRRYKRIRNVLTTNFC